jgi:serine phosphatase RsbU (regulator of sigma subunit)
MRFSKHILFFLLCCILPCSIFSQQGIFHLDSLPAYQSNSYSDPGLPVNVAWRYHKGDDPSWASPLMDDSSWKLINPELSFDSLEQGTFESIGWFRLHIIADTTLLEQALGLQLTQSGASEVFLDGRLLHRFGSINVAEPEKEEHFDPQYIPVDILFRGKQEHLLAIRYANARALADYQGKHITEGGFRLKFSQLADGIFYKYINSNILTGVFTFYFTFFIALSILHFTFFIFYRTNRSNLYYSIFTGAFGTFFLSLLFNQVLLLPDFTGSFNHFASYLSDFYAPALLAMLYSIFYPRIPKVFWLWIALSLVDLVITFTGADNRIFGTCLYFIFLVESLRVIIVAIYKKKDGAWIIGTGVITTVLFFLFFMFLSIVSVNSSFTYNGWGGFLIGLMVVYATLSIPLSMTVYLARDFSKTSKNLTKKLLEVEALSAKTLEQEKEKQRILETQKEMLETQVQERTHEISEQKKLIEEKNKDITDSISYAKRIQEAILPEPELLNRIFPEAFILFKPKDIVSGDFYWFTEAGSKKIFAAADCTGHGVPGALMSMIGCNILNKLVPEQGITQPDLILNRLHEEIRSALRQKDKNSDTRDGMDIAVIAVENGQLQYAAAHRPLYLVRNGTLEEIKADKFPVGGIQTEEKRVFTNHVLTLQTGDAVYLSSDGFADQFGGESGKKLMTKHFKELLLKISKQGMQEQKQALDEAIEKWKGSREQVDDILVVGIRL